MKWRISEMAKRENDEMAILFDIVGKQGLATRQNNRNVYTNHDMWIHFVISAFTSLFRP